MELTKLASRWLGRFLLEVIIELGSLAMAKGACQWNLGSWPREVEERKQA